MNVNINTSKCNGCLNCIKVCPVKVIELNDMKRAEVVRPDFCVHCAHCMSVCSNKAISADFPDSRLGREIASLNMPAAEQVKDLLLTRRSIRAYSKRKIGKDKIQEVLNLAAHAPTAHNDQDVKFIVTGPDRADELEKLAHNYYKGLKRRQIGIITREAGFKILLGAPVTIALYSKKSNRGNMNLSLWNCLIAAQNILIAAHGMGLGGCYNGLSLMAYRKDPEVRKFFNIPNDMEIYMFVELGYPEQSIKYLNIIERKEPDIIWK